MSIYNSYIMKVSRKFLLFCVLHTEAFDSLCFFSSDGRNSEKMNIVKVYSNLCCLRTFFMENKFKLKGLNSNGLKT